MVKRPISPFLAIYKPQVGSIFSILERISGIVLLFTFIVYLLLFSLKNNFLSFYFFYQIFYFFVKLSFADTSLSAFILFIIFNFIYHLLFSFRYLAWSYSGGIFKYFNLNLEGLYYISNLLLFATFGCSFLVWCLI